MNNDPQLIIFEPLKDPRTVILNVTEDIDSDPAIIFDENGRRVLNYKVLHDEPLSLVNPDREKIIAYIQNWESQGNIINQKQARKIEKRKRIQAAKKLRKERNKKKKTAMKSLIRCSFDSSDLNNAKNVEEERAILRAMKTQKHSIKSILNIKPNRIINCNTNVRPFENSTIEIGCRKTPIDVVVLDSDEGGESSDDEIQISIDPPQSVERRNRRTNNFSDDCTFRNQNSFVTSNPISRKRRNKKQEVIQIVDISDSDVECVSCEEYIESLSDEDDDNCDTPSSKKTRMLNVDLEKESSTNSKGSDCISVDEDANDELTSLVDSFVDKYIKAVMPTLTDIPVTDSDLSASKIVISECSAQSSDSLQKNETALSRIVITEPVSLQPGPLKTLTKPQKSGESASQLVIAKAVSLNPDASQMQKESKKTEKIDSEIVITDAVSLQPNLSRNQPKSQKKNQKKQVAFNYAIDKEVVNDDELVIVENEPPDGESLAIHPMNALVQSDSASNADCDTENQSMSDDSNESEVVSENEDNRNRNVIEFDSIPSPDYTPTENIPATASNIKAFADFMRRRQIRDFTSDDDFENDSPIEMEKCIQSSTTKSPVKSNDSHLTSADGISSKPQTMRILPRQKSYFDKSDEVQIAESPTVSRKRLSHPDQENSFGDPNEVQIVGSSTVNRKTHCHPWQKRRCDEPDEITVIDQPTAVSNLPSRPWLKSCRDRSDEILLVEPRVVNRNEPFTFETRLMEEPCPIDSDNQIRSQIATPDRKSRKKLHLSNASQANVNISDDSQNQCSNITSFRRFNNTDRMPPIVTPYRNRRPPIFNRFGGFQNSTPKSNSALKFFDKNSIRIGCSQNKSAKVRHDEKHSEQERFVKSTDSPSHEFFKLERNRNPEESYHDQGDLQRRPFNQKFQQQKGPEYGTSVDEKDELRQLNSESENKVNVKEDMNNTIYDDDEPHQREEHRDEFNNPGVPIQRLNQYHPEPYEGEKMVPQLNRFHSKPYRNEQFASKRNRYQPESYEEDKYDPRSEHTFGRKSWRNQNRYRPFYRPQSFRSNQYHNRQMEYNKNDLNQSNRFRPRFTPNQGQTFNRYPANRRFFRQNMPNSSICNQRTEGDSQHLQDNVRSSYAENNHHASQSQTSTQQQPNQEVLFTRRQHKANADNFIDCNYQQPQSHQQNSHYRSKYINSNQLNTVDSYECNVAEKLHSNANNGSTFSWENDQACDFVPLNATRTIEASPPWRNDNSNYNPRIKAISRREWINDTINMRT